MSAAPRPETTSRLEPFRLRGANFNLLVLRLLDHRAEAVVPALGDQFRRAPGFLRFAPIVIGLSDLAVAPAEMDFGALIQGLRQLEIVPIGTTGGTPELRNAAISYGLPPLRVAKEGADFTIPAGGNRTAHFDDTGAPDHYPVNKYSLYYTDTNALDVTVTVSAQGVKVQTATITKDEGGAEVAD